MNKTLFYFPSYEFLLTLFTDPWREDNRHPHDYVIQGIMKTFEAVYCGNETTLADANAFFQELRQQNLLDAAKGAERNNGAGAGPVARDKEALRAARRAKRKAARAALAQNGSAAGN